MNSKFKSALWASAPIAFIILAVALVVTSCQEPSLIPDQNASGSAAAVITVGNGDRVTLTTNQHWTSGNTYILDGEVLISGGATLTIDAGVIIKGKKDPTPSDSDPLNSSLVITTEGKISAIGTSSSPIVFTSDQAAGSRNPGDWGGVIIAGTDVVNQTSPDIEGFSDPISYGGTGDTEGSGTLQYVRIEFAGTILEDGNETNGLTLAGVSSATTVDHIQISRGNDDGLEIFGGTVNVSFVISWQNRDDDFDTDFGHTGVVQYAIARRLNAFVSTESNGIETDNDGTGSTATPETNTKFVNLTVIGPVALSGDGSEVDLSAPNVFNAAMLVRRNSSTSVYNSIFTAWPTGVNLRDDLTAINGIGTSRTLHLLGITYSQPYTGGDYLYAPSSAVPTQTYATAFRNQYNASASANNEVVTTSSGPNAAGSVGLKDAAFNDGVSTAPDFTAASILSTTITSPGTTETFRGASDTDGVVTGGNWNFTTGWLNFNPAAATY